MMLFKNLNFVNFFEDMRFFKCISHKILKIFKPENDKAVANVFLKVSDTIVLSWNTGG